MVAGVSHNLAAPISDFGVGANPEAPCAQGWYRCVLAKRQAGRRRWQLALCSLPSMAAERTFIAIKPDGVQRGLVGEILGRFERKGFKLVGLKQLTPSRELAETHYGVHRERPFFAGLDRKSTRLNSSH